MAKTKKRFVNRAKNRSTETVVKASKASGSSFDSYLKDGTQFYKPRDGENNIRILPVSWDDMDKWGDSWAIMVDIHYGVGADNSAYLCSEKMNGEPCAVCEARSGTDDEEERNQLRANRRALCYVIDRDNEKAGVQVWAMPLTLYREINTRSIDRKTKEAILIDDQDEGYDVTFVKEGTGTRVKYAGVEIARDPTPLSDDDRKADAWLEAIENSPLPDLLNFFEHDHIEKVLKGQVVRKKDDADDEDVKPSRRRRGSVDEDEKPSRRAKAKSRDDDEDDDEDEELDVDDDEDDEEDEKPARGRGRGKSKAKPRDDDEDEDDDDADDDEDEDEDEDEKPARHRRSKSRYADDEDEDDDDDEDDDEDEEDDDPPSKRRASKSKSKSRDDDEDEDDDEDDDDDDDEDDEKPAKKASSRAKAKLEKLKSRRKK